MKKALLILPVMLLLVTGCGKKEVVCTGTVEEDGQKYEMKFIGTLKDDKIDSAKAIMTFSDETTAQSMCGMFALVNSFAEDDDKKIDYKCDGKVITLNSLDNYIDDEEEQIKGMTKDEFIKKVTEENDQITCK